MRVSTAATLALAFLLVTSLVGAVAATPSASGADTAPARTQTLVDRSPSESAVLSPTDGQTLAVQSGSDAVPPPADPHQVIRIAVTDTGDTRWTIESRFLLRTDDDKATFRSYADAVTDGQRDLPYNRQLFADFARDVEQSTGRDMSIQNESWDVSSVQPADDAEYEEDTRIGVIAYSFTWTNLATVDDERIYFGDAFQSQTGSGSWLGTFDDGMRLVIEPPENYDFEDAPTGLQNGNLVWDGPHQFGQTELEIVFVRNPPGNASPLPVANWMIGAVAVLLFLVAAGSYALARWSPDPGRGIHRIRALVLGALGRDEESEATPPGAPDVDSRAGPDSTATADPISEEPSGPADGADTRLEFEEEIDDEIDPELLSDEERVLRMLKRNNGRMKQASIVKETGWSNAKVSQLLSQMDEDDEIEKLRIGRENLITLPEVDPTAID